MASFGSFETDREIYSGPTYTVYSAKKAGDPTTEYAVKVFSLHHAGMDTEFVSQLDPLLSDLEAARTKAIALQERAAKGSEFVTPIFESGQDERGVWYATLFYPRSVNKIISGRVALNREALEFLLRSITRGALDLKRICGRSHGDIQPSNVQISRSEKLTEAKVVLSDPMPGDAGEAAPYELADLRSIGRILLQLVLRREISNEDDSLVILPILSSPEWTRLFGKEADQWLALCNRLLDPSLSLEQITLNELIDQFEKLRAKPPLSRKAIAAMAAGVVVIGLAGVFALRHFNRGHLRITTDPPGADVKLEIDGQFRSFGKTPPDKTPLVIKGLPKGNYNLQADFPGLTGQSGTVVVEGGKTRPYEFSFPYGVVRITSDPPGASVELEGQNVGTTPFTSTALAPGPRTYTVRLPPDHEPAKVQVVVLTNRQVHSFETTLRRMRAGEGVVEFASIPLGATIRDGTNILGDAPIARSLSPGPHRITAQYQDWPPVTTDITVASGQGNPPVEIRLPHGVARFDITPPDSELFLNNVSIGRDVSRKALQPMEYTLVVSRAGYETMTNRIAIVDMQTTNIVIALKPMLGFVEFTTVPPGAAIFDAANPARELGRTAEGQPLRRSFQPGSYSFIARYPGLDDVSSQRLNIAMGTSTPLTLRFQHAAVQFDSEPDGAAVLIANREVGRTPYTHYQKPGSIAYRVQLEDYYPQDGSRDLALGTTTPISFRLRRQDMPVVLRSDPPGAQFLFGDTLLQGTNDLYAMPWGTNQLIARHPLYRSLVELRESVVVRKGAQNAHEFKFDYGTIVLTNLPEELTIKEGNNELGVHADGLMRVAYERPGLHNYGLYDGDDKATNITVRVESGMRTIVPPGLVGEVGGIRNGIGMRLVKVRNLLGPGKDAWVGKYEVTQREYQTVMGANPSGHQLGDNYPVENVTWEQAVEFCRKLKASDDKKPPVRVPYEYRLPAKAEWLQFAEGTNERDAVVRTRLPAVVGSRPANPKRLHDVYGNVWEWLADSNGVDGEYIGAAYNMGFGLQFTKSEKRLRTSSDTVIGFRVMLVPLDTAAANR